MMGSHIEFIPEETVKRHLPLNKLVEGVEKAMQAYSSGDGEVIQPTRILMPVPDGAFLAMPAFVRTGHLLGCKLVTSFPKNKERNLPSITGNILLFDGLTGHLKKVMEAETITGYRTAAASCVATKYMHRGKKNILAILGAGVQGETHARLFQRVFNFKQVRIWNRTHSRAESLCRRLGNDRIFTAVDCPETCVRGADVICTTTSSNSPLVMFNWLQPDAHISAVGSGSNHFSELELDIYKNCSVITDSLENARKELEGLLQQGVSFSGEVGQLINGQVTLDRSRPTVFQSLGMAVEDVAAAQVVLDEIEKYKASNN